MITKKKKIDWPVLAVINKKKKKGNFRKDLTRDLSFLMHLLLQHDFRLVNVILRYTLGNS